MLTVNSYMTLSSKQLLSILQMRKLRTKVTEHICGTVRIQTQEIRLLILTTKSC